jgi:hypothetical protein
MGFSQPQVAMDTIAYKKAFRGWKYYYLDHRIRGFEISQLFRENDLARRDRERSLILRGWSMPAALVGGTTTVSALGAYLSTDYFCVPVFFGGAGLSVLSLALDRKVLQTRHRAVRRYNDSLKISARPG